MSDPFDGALDAHIARIRALAPTPRQRRDALEASDREWQTLDLGGRHLSTSLEDWLHVLDGNEVSTVDATRCARVFTDDLLQGVFLGDGTEAHELISAADFLDALVQFGKHTSKWETLRWDFCAGRELKVRMAMHGIRGLLNRDFGPIADDRVYELGRLYPRLTCPLYRRPWVEALRFDRAPNNVQEDSSAMSWPAELRVFVSPEIPAADGLPAGIAVSNYYPQSVMPPDAYDVALRAAETVARLRDSLKKPVETPWVGAKGDDTYTVDFILPVSGEERLQVLEAGPFYGAHPCCFEDREMQGVAYRSVQS